MAGPPRLSVVIPAFNEAARLPVTLERIGAFLGASPRWLPAEVVVVDDGSSDETCGVALRIGPWEGVEVVVRRFASNRGKGAAVREGLATSRGEWVLISDADLATPIEEVDTLAAAGADLASGSRGLRRELILRHQPRLRELGGRVLNLAFRLLGLTRLTDTQCGFKLLEGGLARRLATRLRLDGFAYDLELLARAERAGGRVVEVPVRWFHVEESSVRPLRHGLQVLRDAVVLRCWLWLGR
jgi:dolichyl-phosphate beta-glucosyltransferase